MVVTVNSAQSQMPASLFPDLIAFNPVVTGTAADDSLSGTASNDILDGLAGNDVLSGNSGTDLLLGDDGNDRLLGGSGTDALFGEEGDDLLDGGQGSDLLRAGNGNDLLDGGSESDLLLAGSGQDVALGGGGDDRVSGGDGDDILDGDATLKAIGLTDRNTLAIFNPNQPDQISKLPVQGVDGTLVGIDLRPADGQFYGLTDTDKVYTVDIATGQTKLVATLNIPFTAGTQSGVDFNPTPDRLRVVGSNEQNLRINLTPGANPVAISDLPLAYAEGDPNFGQDPNIVAAAYTRSFAPSPDATRATTLYEIDSNLDVLVRQGGLDFLAATSPASDSPNNGKLSTIGKLGIDFTAASGFDILETPNGFRLPLAATRSTLYTIDLNTGAARSFGQIGDGTVNLTGLTVALVEDPVGGNDILLGGNGNDRLTGRAGRDRLDGEADNDTLDGGSGRDSLTGGTGDDFLTGGSGSDLLTGSSGSDTFAFQGSQSFQIASLGLDRITDFQTSLDKILLDQTVFGPLTLDQIAIVNTDRAAATSAGLITYSLRSGTLFFNQNGALDGLGTGDKFARLDGAPQLKTTDFVIVA